MARLSLVRTDDAGDVAGTTAERVDSMANDLAEAAGAALGDGGELAMSGDQIPLIPACKVKFVSMAWDSLDAVPNLKDEMVFLVKARIVGHGQEVMKDGDIRETAKAEVLRVVEYAGEFPPD